jgi:hypothetical protein
MWAAADSIRIPRAVFTSKQRKQHSLSPAEYSKFQELRTQYLSLDRSGRRPNARLWSYCFNRLPISARPTRPRSSELVAGTFCHITLELNKGSIGQHG